MKQLSPKQYAKELVFKFYKIVGLDGFWYDCNPVTHYSKEQHKLAQKRSKECALESVDGKIDELQSVSEAVGVHNIYLVARLLFLNKVKQEIKNYNYVINANQ